MKFNLGEYRRMYGGAKYVKDTYQVQEVPPQEEEQKEEPQVEVKMSGEPSLQPIIDEIKEETNGPIQSEQVVKERTPKSSKPVRKSSRSRS